MIPTKIILNLKKKRAKKNTKNIDSKLLKTKCSRTMLLSKCPICSSKKSRFIKEQEVKGILSSLGLKTQLSNVPLFGEILVLIFSNLMI